MGAVSLAAAVCAGLAVAWAMRPHPCAARLRRLQIAGTGGTAGLTVARGAGPSLAGNRLADGSAKVCDSAPVGDASSAAPVRQRQRVLAATAAGCGAALFFGGLLGLAAGGAIGAGLWVWLGRLQPREVVQQRDLLVATVPLAAELLAAALAAGCPSGLAVEAVGMAIPGPLGARLTTVAANLQVGADPITAWASFTDEPAVRDLGRVMVSSAARGTSPVAALERIARDADDVARWAAESKARSVGAKAAVPLGLCFLPAFILVGVVPVIATSISLLP